MKLSFWHKTFILWVCMQGLAHTSMAQGTISSDSLVKIYDEKISILNGRNVKLQRQVAEMQDNLAQAKKTAQPAADISLLQNDLNATRDALNKQKAEVQTLNNKVNELNQSNTQLKSENEKLAAQSKSTPVVSGNATTDEKLKAELLQEKANSSKLSLENASIKEQLQASNSSNNQLKSEKEKIWLESEQRQKQILKERQRGDSLVKIIPGIQGEQKRLEAELQKSQKNNEQLQKTIISQNVKADSLSKLLLKSGSEIQHLSTVGDANKQVAADLAKKDADLAAKSDAIAARESKVLQRETAIAQREEDLKKLDARYAELLQKEADLKKWEQKLVNQSSGTVVTKPSIFDVSLSTPSARSSSDLKKSIQTYFEAKGYMYVLDAGQIVYPSVKLADISEQNMRLAFVTTVSATGERNLWGTFRLEDGTFITPSTNPKAALKAQQLLQELVK